MNKEYKLGIFSPSGGVLNFFPNKIKRGVKALEKKNLIIEFAPHSFENISYFSSPIQNRVADINYLLDKDDIDGLMCSMGGFNSNQLLSSLDYDKIKKSNKFICGYSDATAILLAIYSLTNKIVLHGPTFLPELCEYPEIYDYTLDYFKKVITKETFVYKEPEYVVKEFIDWKEQEENPKARNKEKNLSKWSILNKGEITEKIIGGNLSTLMNILGSKYLPYEIFDNKILFVEDCNGPIANFDSMLYGLKIQGILDRISGLIVGKLDFEYKTSDLKRILENLITKKIPVIYDIDLGHTNPKITIPIGATVKLKCDSTIEFSVVKY